LEMLPPTTTPRYMEHIRTLAFKSLSARYLWKNAPTIANISSLTSLLLSFYGSWLEGPLPLDRKWELSQVTTLHIQCQANKMYAENPSDSLFAVISFPNLSTLSIPLLTCYTPIALPLHGFLVGQNHYLVLETLNIFVAADLGDDGNPILLVLPNCYIPSLRHLRIRSPLEGLILANKAINPYSGLELSGGDGISVALRRITLDLPSPRSATSWVSELASKMQDHNCWDGFSEVVVKSGAAKHVILQGMMFSVGASTRGLRTHGTQGNLTGDLDWAVDVQYRGTQKKAARSEVLRRSMLGYLSFGTG